MLLSATGGAALISAARTYPHAIVVHHISRAGQNRMYTSYGIIRVGKNHTYTVYDKRFIHGIFCRCCLLFVM